MLAAVTARECERKNQDAGQGRSFAQLCHGVAALVRDALPLAHARETLKSFPGSTTPAN
jgi:hypothetical protein